ncbi:MAG TPA: DUF6516 family protein [Gammaproteobacteria bacterium]|jgi:hypothetical protein|nr:DUF6516 family protein [Gammaproteobacteria bacterium]
MKAELLFRKRLSLTETAFVELVVHRVPTPVPSSRHNFKYRLALISDNVCVLRYDNESGKGDHQHVAGEEVPYDFRDLSTLEADFWRDVESWRNSDGNRNH